MSFMHVIGEKGKGGWWWGMGKGAGGKVGSILGKGKGGSLSLVVKDGVRVSGRHRERGTSLPFH